MKDELSEKSDIISFTDWLWNDLQLIKIHSGFQAGFAQQLHNFTFNLVGVSVTTETNFKIHYALLARGTKCTSP